MALGISVAAEVLLDPEFLIAAPKHKDAMYGYLSQVRIFLQYWGTCLKNFSSPHWGMANLNSELSLQNPCVGSAEQVVLRTARRPFCGLISRW